MLPRAGLRRWVGMGTEPDGGWTLARRSAALPAPSADVFIRDFGPLAASVFKGAELAEFEPVCGGFPAGPDRRGFGVSCSVMPGFFRIAKSVFSKIANRFGVKIVVSHKLRGLLRLIQAKQRFPSNPGCIKLERPTATRDAHECRPTDTAAGVGRPPKRNQKLDDLPSICTID